MATAQRSTVVGVFHDRAMANQAVEALKAAGFRDDQIGVAGRFDEGTGIASEGTGSKWEEGAVTGVLTGAGLGALVGLGILAGVIPAVGPVIAGGTLIALLASAGAGAAAGTLLGGLIGFGIPEDDAAYFDGEFQAGRTLLTVHTPDGRYAEARAVMHQHGATERPATTVGVRD